jgi:hypothetical protein
LAAKESLCLICTETDVTRAVGRGRSENFEIIVSEPVMPGSSEPSIKELLSDPIVRALMSADGIHTDELEGLLCSVAKRLERAVQSVPPSTLGKSG